MSDRWGVWFSDGEFSVGWLQEEHGNGRLSPYRGDEEEAKAKATLNEDFDQEGYCFSALCIDAPEEEQAKVTEEVHQRARARQRARWA
jgi:hypothetical protein